MHNPHEIPNRDPAEATDFDRLLPHLLALRSRLIRCLLIIGVIFLALLPFSNHLYTWLALPLLQDLPIGATMIATAITASFLAPLKLTIICACLLAIPFLLHQTWTFIAPALYQHEKRWMWLLLLTSTVLFYLGMAFGYGIVFPLLFHFLANTAPASVTVMPDMHLYLDFAMQLLLVFGVIFEIPVIIVLLIKAGITTRKNLAKQRPYFIIAAFVIGMLVAPDVISQILIALPMWLLFEIGLWIGNSVKK